MKWPLPISVCILAAGLTLATSACELPTDDDDDPGPQPLAMRLDAETDTLLLLAGNTHTLKVMGVFAKTTENVVTNTGVLIDANFTYITTDTTMESMAVNKLDWYSSDANVATVDDGEITGIASGPAAVWAETGEVASDTLQVIVNSPQLPPNLILDPPPTQLVFQDSIVIAGWVTAGLNATVTINSDTVSVDSRGRFMKTVTFATGVYRFDVTAINNDNGLSTTKSKQVVYFPLATAGITGYWEGETLTRPFGFDINEFLGVYVIDGTMIIDATMLGGPLIIQDVIIAGWVNEDGTLEATLSKETSGTTLTGTLEGVFLSSGTATGTWSVSISIEGLPTATATAKWTAEREE